MPDKITISAIICEFDPLHWGHLGLLEKAGAGGAAVCCVMSGNFLQRGGPAMLDKWHRAQCALEAGADLVAELPLSWACAGAERFAAGGAALAGALGASRLYFGSEVPDAALLLRLARTLLSPEFSAALRAQAQPGLSFAVRRQKAVEALLGPEAARLLALPNATLGVEYCKAILSQGLAVQPVAVPRTGSGHGQEAPVEPGAVLSASHLRSLALQGRDLRGLVPDFTLAALEEAREQGRFPVQIKYLERAVLCKLRGLTLEDFAALPGLSEGLEHRLAQAVGEASSLEELYARVKSKRYPHARVRRLVMAAFLGLREPLPALPPYLRVLGMSERGGRILNGRAGDLPLAVRAGDFRKLPAAAQEGFRLEVRADDVYALASPRPQPAGRDYWELFRKPLG